MEIVFEIIGGLFEALFDWFLESEKIPKWLRAVIICLLDGAMIGLFILIIVLAKNIGMTIFMGLLIALFVYGGIRKVRTILK